jgi:hypothetical protein
MDSKDVASVLFALAIRQVPEYTSILEYDQVGPPVHDWLEVGAVGVASGPPLQQVHLGHHETSLVPVVHIPVGTKINQWFCNIGTPNRTETFEIKPNIRDTVHNNGFVVASFNCQQINTELTGVLIFLINITLQLIFLAQVHKILGLKCPIDTKCVLTFTREHNKQK